MKPLAIDLFCGLGGWSEGLLAEGWDVIGFDIERHEYGEQRYPAQLVLQDVLTLHGSQFKTASLIVASPPCQEYSYMAMPWSRAKEKQRKLLEGPAEDRARLTALFDACFRIQREACEAAGRYIPLVVENVKGAQKWVGRSRWSFGSFHLWGDIPALMPIARGRKNAGGSWFNVAHNTESGCGQNPDGRKVAGLNWSNHGKPGYKAEAFNDTAIKRMRAAEDGNKQGGDRFATPGSISRTTGSKSPARKAASAMIAKIPLPLSRHIAAVWQDEAGIGSRCGTAPGVGMKPLAIVVLKMEMEK